MNWLIGTGPMAKDYVKVLQSLKEEVLVIGRSPESTAAFASAHNVNAVAGGVAGFLDTRPALPAAVIVSVSVEQLAPVTAQLLRYGVRKLLVEKPGGLDSQEIGELAALAKVKNAAVFIAYNRRFYTSTLEARQLIEADGGVTSFNFEITEWSHVIANHQKDPRVMERWFTANTSHVIDMAFHLGGKPKEICSFHAGSTPWHPASSNFVGAGVSTNGALFTYYGNWRAPGRWSVEICTKAHRFIFRPMEELQVQNIGSVAVERVTLDDHLDKEFKPGLFLQVRNFLSGITDSFCTVHDQITNVVMYESFAGYANYSVVAK